MAKNGKFDCFKCVLHCFRRRYDLYIPIYQNSNFHHFDFFSQKNFNLMIQIWRGVLRDEFLVFGMCLETSYLFPKIFLPGYFYDLFTTHYFFWKLSKSGILRSAFIDVEFFGMSSYDPKSSSIEKFETWRTFFICITSSYLP